MKKQLSKLCSSLLIIVLTGCGTVTTSSQTPSTSQTPSISSSQTTSATEPTSDTSSASSIATTSESDSALTSINENYPFVPGALGALPLVEGLNPNPNEFAGLYIESLDRYYDSFAQGSRAEVLLKFPEPFEVGTNSYRLQRYNTETSSWENYGEDYVSTYNNFVLPARAGERFRLLAEGGDIDGYHSNEVIAGYTSIETRFTGYSLDESMFLTGIIAPFVGRGLEAGFTVMTLDSEEVTSGLTYQWYRVNPYTFEHHAIPGATSLTYETTMADLGYEIAIRAIGDEINVGGFYEVLANGGVTSLPIPTFGSNVTNFGFDINFAYTLPEIELDRMEVLDSSYETVEIESIVLNLDKNSATITFKEKNESSTYFLNYAGPYFTLVSSGEYMISMVEIKK